MCGCGCELGLVLAACRAAEVHRDASPAALTGVPSQPQTVFEQLIAAWLASLFDERAMQRSPLGNLSRGSGR